MIKIIGRRILSLINPRYSYLPQIEEYDNLSQDFALYSMFTHTKNFSGNHITTDNYGFRYSEFKNKLISLETELFSQKKINLIIGGSTVFGVGASNDKNTISSLLSKTSNERWINLGLRAGNSFQEYINLIKVLGKIKNIDKIIFLSGINDIYISLLFGKTHNNLDDLIFDNSKIEDFLNSYSLKKYSFIKQIIAFILSSIKNENINDLIRHKSFSKMIKFKSSKHLINKNVAKTNFEKMYSNFERNFLLYSALENKLINTKITFFLQPYFSWTNKQPNIKENEIFEFNKLNFESSSRIHKKMNQGVYLKINKFLKELSLKYGLNFYDLNTEKYGSKEDFIFADSVHLTDEGNMMVSNHIFKNIYT